MITIYSQERRGGWTTSKKVENAVGAKHLTADEKCAPGVALLQPSIQEILDNSEVGRERRL